VALLSCQVFGQSTETPPAFEAASVKPNKSGDGRLLQGHRDGLNATGAELKFLMMFAYDVRDNQISGGPSWVNSERYDIVAKGTGDHPTLARNRQMLQTLLVD